MIKYVLLVAVAIAALACNKKSASNSAAPGSASAAASGSAPGSAAAPAVEDVPCDVAAKEYTKKMAAAPGNILSDAKPDDGLIAYTAVSMEDYCVGEDGCCVPWTPAERACVKSADASTVASCFTGAAASQVMAGLTEVVTSALENKKNNEAAATADDNIVYASLSVHGDRDRDEVDKEIEANWAAKWKACFAGADPALYEVTFKVAADGKMTLSKIETSGSFDAKPCLTKTLTEPFSAGKKMEILPGFLVR